MTLTRLNEQLAWYSRKSRSASRKFKTIKITEILAAALIPFLGSLPFQGLRLHLILITGALGVLITILEGLLHLNQYQQNWTSYRATAKAAQAGKHVLCEKPLSLTVAEAESLLEVRRRTGVKIGEAFMIRSFAQWLRVEELIRAGRIGELRAVTAFFSYFNADPKNIRNQVETGGGALYDIGCYCIQAARIGFGALPRRVAGLIERDPQMRTDRLTSALLDFPGGHAIFTCGTQLVPYQKVQFLGAKGRIEMEIPFNAPRDRPTRIFLDETGDLSGSGIVTEEFPTADQYTAQGDAFSRAILEDTEVPVPLEDAIANMKVIEGIFRSAEIGGWIAI